MKLTKQRLVEIINEELQNEAIEKRVKIGKDNYKWVKSHKKLLSALVHSDSLGNAVVRSLMGMHHVYKLVEGLNEDMQPFNLQSNPDVQKSPDDYISGKRKPGGSVKMYYNSYSSNEAKKIVEGELADYIKMLRKTEQNLIKSWLSAAKLGAIDFFDLMRGFNVGDVRRGHKYEIDFLSGLLERDKIQDRFRSYFKGRKGKRRN